MRKNSAALGAALALGMMTPGCFTNSVRPHRTPEERAEELPDIQRLPALQQSFRVSVGQLLGMKEVLQARARELTSADPAKAERVLQQIRQIDALVQSLPAETATTLETNTQRSDRTRREIMVTLRELGIDLHVYSEADQSVINRLKSEAGERGQRMATLHGEIADLRRTRAGAFQQEITTREEEMRRIEAVQSRAVTHGSILRALRPEADEENTLSPEQLDTLKIEIQSAYEAGMGVQATPPSIDPPPRR